MSTILAHMYNDRLYLPMLQKIGDHTNVVASVLHESIFDVYHKIKPKSVILPLHEYTKEFHDFIQTFYDKVDIIIYSGSVEHTQLFDFFKEKNIKIITGLNIGTSDNILKYDKLYDENVYQKLNHSRNHKILVMLSSDIEKNHKFLDNILYPNTRHKLCLINNPQFKSKQNVGVTNIKDLCLALNTFYEFIDVDGNFELEASACGINNISINENLLNNIEQHIYSPSIADLDKYTIKNFVINKVLSFLGA